MSALSQHVAGAPCGHGLSRQGARIGEAWPLQADRKHDQECNESTIHGSSLARLGAQVGCYHVDLWHCQRFRGIRGRPASPSLRIQYTSI